MLLSAKICVNLRPIKNKIKFARLQIIISLLEVVVNGNVGRVLHHLHHGVTS